MIFKMRFLTSVQGPLLLCLRSSYRWAAGQVKCLHDFESFVSCPCSGIANPLEPRDYVYFSGEGVRLLLDSSELQACQLELRNESAQEKF